MAATCPNKNNPVWKELESRYGKELAYYAYDKNGEDIPSLRDGIKIIENFIKSNPPSRIIETPEGMFELNDLQLEQYQEMIERYGADRAKELLIDFIDINDLRKYNVNPEDKDDILSINKASDPGFSNYLLVTSSSELRDKEEILEKFRIKRSKSSYYYVLTKEQQNELDRYIKASRNKATVGESKNGYEFAFGNKGKVIYRMEKGVGYFYISNRKYVTDEEGFILPKIVNKVKVPVTLVFYGEESLYLQARKSGSEYVTQSSQDLKRSLVKTKGSTVGKAVQYYNFFTRVVLLKTLRSLGHYEFTMKRLTDLTLEDHNFIVGILGSKAAREKLREGVEEQLSRTDIKKVREEIKNILTQWEYIDLRLTQKDTEESHLEKWFAPVLGSH